MQSTENSGNLRARESASRGDAEQETEKQEARRKRPENTRGAELTHAVIRALALAVICNLFIFASNELVIIWEAMLAPLIDPDWSWEKIASIIGRIDVTLTIFARLADIEYLAIGALILSACLLFGLWDAFRRLKLLEYHDKLEEINGQLKELSLQDDLTGLHNQRFLKEQLDIEIERGRRHGRPLSLLMLDVDYYKSVNDRFGHAFGDHVLAQLAGILEKSVRKVDVVARYGGDEFVIILPETDEKSALIVYHRILKSVEDHVFSREGVRTRITLSIGAACCVPDRELTGSELMRRADEALYTSKERGRNIVSVWRSDFSAGAADSKGGAKLEEVQKKLYALARENKETSTEPIYALAAALEAKDDYTQRHSIAVMSVSTNIARAMLLPEEKVDQIRNAALLHDIGKIGIGEDILLKEGPLSDEERAVINQHPAIGANILAPIRRLRDLVPMIKHHHERYDGGGYPSGLAGEEIPLGARILAVADAYCAMTSDRPYSSAKTRDEACKEILARAGAQFDPHVAEAFAQSILLPAYK
jgi:diguanylate cyclase (GGDEF)-like protein/putative nucleotidyltransferase with HDIG domain